MLITEAVFPVWIIMTLTLAKLGPIHIAKVLSKDIFQSQLSKVTSTKQNMFCFVKVTSECAKLL